MEQVAHLACDLLENPTDEAEILFFVRFDTDYPTTALQSEAAKKFAKVHLSRCTRRGIGFPAGCNEMALGLFDYILSQKNEGQLFERIDSFLILESDCVITRRSWVEELRAEWQRMLSLGKIVSGSLQPEGKWPGIEEHINAVALYDAELLCYLPSLNSCPPHRGWDHHHGHSIVPYALNSPLFHLDYKRAFIGSEELFASPALVYHGVKDDSALKAVREKYGI